MPRRGDPRGRPRAQRLGGRRRRRPARRCRSRDDRGAETTRCSPADRRQLDHDLVARDAVREEAGRDRQLIAAERRARGGAGPGCWRRRRRSRTPARRIAVGGVERGRRSASTVDVGHARRDRASAPARSRPPSSAASNVARGSRRRARGRVDAVVVERHRPPIGAATAVDEARASGSRDRRAVGRRPIASATSASARPVTPPPHGFSRGCDGVEDRDARAAARERVRRPRAGRARADHRDIIVSSSRPIELRRQIPSTLTRSRSGMPRDTLHGHGRRRARDDSRSACFRMWRGRRRGSTR